MKKLITAIAASAAAIAITSAAAACPAMLSYGSCTCGMCGARYQYQQAACYDRTGEGYYDSMGHYCEYGGYWDGGCWIQTVGYWEGGEWCPAQYDPALDVGYYDEGGAYHLYGGGCQSYGGYGYGYGHQYGETDIWACDDRQWLDAQDCGYADCGYGYGDCGYGYGYEDCSYGYEDCSYAYEDCGYGYGEYENCYIDVDLDADTICVINDGIIVLSGTCACAPIYRGQEFSFDDQLCAGIWNQCSEGFYGQACGYPVGRVCCH